jgi:imidazolonepropionase-like amidohydrolase
MIKLSNTLLIEGNEIRTLSNQRIIRDGQVLIKKGKIVDVGKDIDVPSGVEKVVGDIVTPGLIDAHTHLGICPLESTDSQPMGTDSSDPVSPHLRVIDGINPFDKGLKDALSAGITTVVVSAGSPMLWATMVEPITIMPGQNAIMKTNGRMLKENIGIKMAVGDHPKRFLKSLNIPPTTRMGIMALIRTNLEMASRFLDGSKPITDERERLKIEALFPLLRREIPAHIHVHSANDILQVMRFAEEFRFDPILIHATESHLVVDKISERNVPVIFGPMIFPRRGSELKNLTIKTPSVLEENNVLFAISTDHPCTPIEYLSLNAGIAMSEGLKDGLKTITSNPAKIAGIWDSVGSLEKGKAGDVAIFENDPLETDSKILYTIVDGQIEYERD